jgi:hypothetical protein
MNGAVASAGDDRVAAIGNLLTDLYSCARRSQGFRYDNFDAGRTKHASRDFDVRLATVVASSRSRVVKQDGFLQ